MTSDENQIHKNEPIDDLDEDINDNQERESIEDSDTEQTPTNKGFRVGCMVFCLAVTLLFLWVWHHQMQFNDNYRKASFHMKNEEPEQAIDAYLKAIKNKKRTLFFKNAPSAYNNLGEAYKHAEQYQEAIETFKGVIKMEPDKSEGYVNLATVFLRMNDPKSANAICLDALQTFPKSAHLHYNLAVAYALLNEHQLALQSLRQAVDLDPDFRELAQEENALLHIVPRLE